MPTIKPANASSVRHTDQAGAATNAQPVQTAEVDAAAQAPAQAPNLQAAEKPEGYVTGAPTSTATTANQGLSPLSARIDNLTGNTAINEGFRFSKHSGPDINFPLTPDQAEKLKNSNAVSPYVPSDHRVVIQPDYLPKPTHPEDPAFWPEFEQIVDLQMARRGDAKAGEMIDLPKIFADYTFDEGAQAVRADFPTKWPTALVEQFLGEGAKMDPSIMKPMSRDDFVNGPVLLARTLGWAVSEVSPSAFACKWNEGRARPESVAWAIHTGKLEAPQHIKDKVAEMKLTKPEDFTAYKEGCPKHPSWPAMHSAASSASLYLAVLMDLSPEQLAEAKKLDYAVAHFRSMAGVHYETDNRAGLALGQEVIAKQLPEYLAQFGADPEAVKAKIEKVRHDWYAYEAKAESLA